MPEKPSQNEDEYFVKRDAELIRQQQAQAADAAQIAERKSHYMRCPKCGGHLATKEHGGVQVDQCPDCQGLWLDNGELEQLLKHEDPGFIGRVFGEFFGSLKKK